MMQNIRRHTWYYTSLFLILIASVVLVLQANGDTSMQMLAVVMAGFFYALWGIIHHYREHDLSAKIVLEYVLISSLGMTAVYFLFSIL
jgi:hypothetical protein